MANDKGTQTAPKTGDGTESWDDVQDHRPMYKPEECGKVPVIGIMLGVVEMNPAASNIKEDVPLEEQMWNAVVVLLSAPSKAIENGKVIDVSAGRQILVGGADLASMYQRANHPTLAFEVKFTPTEEIKLKGGMRRMWMFSKKVNPTPFLRAQRKDLIFYEGSGAGAPQLAPAPATGAPALPPGPNATTAPHATA